MKFHLNSKLRLLITNKGISKPSGFYLRVLQISIDCKHLYQSFLRLDIDLRDVLYFFNIIECLDTLLCVHRNRTQTIYELAQVFVSKVLCHLSYTRILLNFQPTVCQQTAAILKELPDTCDSILSDLRTHTSLLCLNNNNKM